MTKLRLRETRSLPNNAQRAGIWGKTPRHPLGIEGYSHAQICQGVSSKDEGFVYIVGELEHTDREEKGVLSPGRGIQNPEGLG